jgi:hypothetical protein
MKFSDLFCANPEVSNATRLGVDIEVGEKKTLILRVDGKCYAIQCVELKERRYSVPGPVMHVNVEIPSLK